MAGGGDVRIIGANNRVKDGVANVTDNALHVKLVGGSLVSACCLLVDGSNALDTGAALFNVNPAVTQGDGLRVIASSGTPALGATGPGITFGAIGESVAAKRAAVVPVQGTADADQVGVGIYIHPDADGTQDLVQAAHFRYDGRVFIGNSDQGGTLNVSNDANPTGITTVAIVCYNPGILATSASILRAKTSGATGGDPIVQFEISGVQTYAMGPDNDDGDKFKIAASGSVQIGTFFFYDPSTGVSNFNGDGTGANFILQTSNTIAGAVANQISNTNNASGAAHALLDMRTGGASGGDPYFRMRVGQGSGQFWSHGIDNSDDRYHFSAASALGSSDALIIGTTAVDIPIDLIFTGDGSGVSFGEIYAEDNAVETAIAVSGTYVQVTVFDNNGESNNSTPDHTNDHITIDHAGRYLILVSCSLLSGAGAGAIYESEVRTNNGANSFPNIHFDRQLAGGGGDVGSASMSGIADLAANDTVEVWVRNKTNTTNITFEDINLTVVEIGGT